MSSARLALGAAFAAILFLGAVYAALSPILQPIQFPRIQMPLFTAGAGNVVDEFSLKRGTNVSGTVKYVVLNVTMKYGGVNILFSDTPNLACNVSFSRNSNNSELQTAYSESNSSTVLNVDLYGENGALNVTLGKGYQYSGVCGLKIGGVTMGLNENSNVSKFAVSIKYIGGLLLKVDSGASFERIDFDVNAGGLQLTVNATSLRRDGAVNANVEMGGVVMNANVDKAEVGVSLNSTVDVGGVYINNADFEGPNSAAKTTGYASATSKLDVNVAVGLGGVLLQQNAMFNFG